MHNTGVVPLFFYARNPERSLTVIPPLLLVPPQRAQRRERLAAGRCSTSTSTTARPALTSLFPLFWSCKRGRQRDRGRLPVLLARRRRERRPVVDARFYRSFWSSGPGTAHARRPDRLVHARPGRRHASNAFLPLFYEASGPDHFALFTLAGRLPALGAVADLVRAAPLICVARQRPDAGSAWSSRSGSAHTDKATERTTTVIPPLLFVSRTTPAESFTTALALFWRYRDIASATTWCCRCYYDVHDYQLAGRRCCSRSSSATTATPTRPTAWVSPFFYSHTTPTYGTTFGLPLVVLPAVLGHPARQRRDDAGPAALRALAAPRLSSRRWSSRSTTTRKACTRTAPPTARYRRFVGAVLPFYDSGVKRPGDFKWDVLGGIVGRERIGHHKFVRLFWFFNFETGAAPRAQTAWYSAPQRTPRKVAARGLERRGVLKPATSDWRAAAGGLMIDPTVSTDPAPAPTSGRAPTRWRARVRPWRRSRRRSRSLRRSSSWASRFCTKRRTPSSRSRLAARSRSLRSCPVLTTWATFAGSRPRTHRPGSARW